MALNTIRRQPNELHIPGSKVRRVFRERSQLSRANRGVVFRVGEQDAPGVGDEGVEIEGAERRFGGEVWGEGAEAESVLRGLVWGRVGLVLDEGGGRKGRSVRMRF